MNPKAINPCDARPTTRAHLAPGQLGSISH